MWHLLGAAVTSGDGPFAQPVVATSDPATAAPRGRIVVLRGADPQAATLDFYTDRRSLKIAHLSGNGQVAFTFWDPESRLQCCAGGTARIILDDRRIEVFDELPKHGRRAYATVQSPGTVLAGPASGLPADWDDRQVAETDYALANFVIVRTVLHWADVLHLDRAGNHRLAATRAGETQPWSFHYVVP